MTAEREEVGRRSFQRQLWFRRGASPVATGEQRAHKQTVALQVAPLYRYYVLIPSVIFGPALSLMRRATKQQALGQTSEEILWPVLAVLQGLKSALRL